MNILLWDNCCYYYYTAIKFMRYRVLLNYIGYIVLFLFMFCCASRRMDEESFRAYLRDKSNGLIKNIPNEVFDIEVAYFPPQLARINSSQEEPVNDSVDYFMAKFESGKQAVDPSQIDVYASCVLIGGDTLEVVDALVIPGANTVSRNFSVMYAFKSFLLKRKADEQIVFFIDRNYSDTHAEFLRRDIEAVKDIKIR